ncbi:MAG: acyltransferase family protein [Clostridia bacterium]|nr:acyltransferase family protein [Clostridia bacterium]
MTKGITEKKRLVGIDIIKALSVFFVVVIHFYLNSAYYTAPLGGPNMFVQSYIRWIVLSGVPLFIMCTGYLNYKKEASASYYGKITSVIIPYAVISVICIAVKHFAGIEAFDFKKSLYSVFNFSADNYSWYVNMYIGLFLLAPIFNYCIKSTDRSQLKNIIIVLSVTISLPSTFNQIIFSDEKFQYFRFPEWWQNFYPVLFYFLGAYIAKYGLRVKKAVLALIALVLPVIQTAAQFVFCNKPNLDNWVFYNNGSLYFVIEAVCIFALLYSIEGKSNSCKKILKTVSCSTLEIYLFSYLSDTFIYSYLKNATGLPNNMNQQEFFIKYFALAVILSFAISLAVSVAYKYIYGFVVNGIKKISVK